MAGRGGGITLSCSRRTWRTSPCCTGSPVLLAAAVACGMLVVAPSVAKANLLPNPSADTGTPDGTQPKGWETDSWGKLTPAFSWPAGGHSGGRHLRVQVSKHKSGDAKWWSSAAPLQGVGKLRVRVWYRSDVSTTALVRFIAGEQKAFATVAKVGPTDVWKEATGAVSAPSWATHFRVMQILKSDGFLATDSWSVTDAALDDVALPAKGATPTVSIAFDGAWRSAHDLLLPVLEDAGWRATHFVPAGLLDKPRYAAERVDSSQLLALRLKGHELASQGLDGSDLTDLSAAALDAQLAQSKSRLLPLGGKIAGFAPPDGEDNKDVRKAISAHYAYSRQLEGGSNKQPWDTYELRSEQMRDETDVEELAELVAKASKKGAGRWLILTYRQAATTPKTKHQVRPKRFAQHVAYLKLIGAKVLPIGEVMQQWSPANPPKPGPLADTWSPVRPAQHAPDSTYSAPTSPADGCTAGAARSGHDAPAHLLIVLIAVLALGRLRRSVTS